MQFIYINKFIINKLHLSMNSKPLLLVLTIAETCRSGNLLVINLFMEKLLLLSVLEPTISDKAQ